MIERSLELREALDNIAIADRDLQQWELIDAEWDLLKQIKKLLYDHNWEEDPIVPGEVDLLQWWKMNEFQYPHLAAMSRDYLAIPATSTPIKRAFSGGTDLISQKRCSLSAETIRACMCLKSWWKTELKCNK
ncbi:unnamed protein product [Rhizophagus irregularis]|nr:unnamed protein product [Rhizophagus irregularis]